MIFLICDRRKIVILCGLLHGFCASVFLEFYLQPEKVAFDLKLSQSKPIYNAYKAVRESPDWNTLSDARKRIVESMF